MVFGMTLATYTLVHVVISLIGIGAGLAVLLGLLSGKRAGGLDRVVSGDDRCNQRDRLRLSG